MAQNDVSVPLVREPRTRNEKSIVSLLRLLEAIRDFPTKFTADDELINAVKRQSRLGNYSRPADEIFATSRCTIERLSDRLFKGGFSSFECVRNEAKDALQAATTEASRPKRRTKAQIQNDLQGTEAERVQALVDCWHVTNAFHSALKAGRSLALLTRDPALVSKWDKEEAILLAMFDLAQRPVVKSKTEAEKWLKALRF